MSRLPLDFWQHNYFNLFLKNFQVWLMSFKHVLCKHWNSEAVVRGLVPVSVLAFYSKNTSSNPVKFAVVWSFSFRRFITFLIVKLFIRSVPGFTWISFFMISGNSIGEITAAVKPPKSELIVFSPIRSVVNLKVFEPCHPLTTDKKVLQLSVWDLVLDF